MPAHFTLNANVHFALGLRGAINQHFGFRYSRLACEIAPDQVDQFLEFVRPFWHIAAENDRFASLLCNWFSP